jgi:hypothetical protein
MVARWKENGRLASRGGYAMRRNLSGPARAELLSGLAAGLLGLLTWGVALFAPLGISVSGSCDSNGACTEVYGHFSLFQSGIEPMTWVFLAILAASFVLVGISAAQHSRSGHSLWRVPLWVATVLILTFVLVAGLSIGLFFAPAGLLALLAACLSVGTQTAEPAQG